jgi:hypothetical protein
MRRGGKGTRRWSRRESRPISVHVSRLSFTDLGVAYCLRTSFDYRVSVEVLVIFYGVTVLDDAFGAAICWWDTVLCC